jgi:charged multivesicular body protein 1
VLRERIARRSRIHAENAIRKKNDSLNFLLFSSKLDATASQIQTASRTETITWEFSHLLPQLEDVMRNMNIENVGHTSEFERLYDDILVATKYVCDSLESSTSVSAPRTFVDELLSQIASEHNIEVQAQNGEVPFTVPIVPQTVARQEERKANMAARHA